MIACMDRVGQVDVTIPAISIKWADLLHRVSPLLVQAMDIYFAARAIYSFRAVPLPLYTLVSINCSSYYQVQYP